MATTASGTLTVYIGKPSAKFYDLRNAMAEVGARIALVGSMPEVLNLLDTQVIKTIVADLDRDPEATRKMIVEIRRRRPEIKIYEGGTPLADVLDDNYFMFAQGLDGTVSHEQFKAAFSKAQHIRRAFVLSMILALVGLLGILVCTGIAKSPMGKLLGTFWSTVLFVEFVYVTGFYFKRLARATKFVV